MAISKTSPQKKTASPKKTAPKNKTAKEIFPIVAIGASAGGLDAMSFFLKNLSPVSGMAYIFVQHLSPNHKSFLTSILAKTTKMKVQEIDDMELMKPNNVYVIPHNKGIKVTDGHIKLIPRSKNIPAISIDILFTSLAITHKENVIGVVLSGNASDGTKGLKDIKKAGGLTIAQDDSAQAKSMPNSAIASGAVDFILSPKEIARKLSRICINGRLKHSAGEKQKAEEVENNTPYIKIILGLLHKETGVDFSHYKMASFKRRLNHKMLQSGKETIPSYVKFLQKNSTEVNNLYKDLLINVTSFFRDTEIFKYLNTTLLPKILKQKNNDEKLRIWVPACSSGEEAYSIAMILTELQDDRFFKIPIQIFCTDLCEPVIRLARNGQYTATDLKFLSKDRVQRFFTKTGDYYSVNKNIREMCVFAPHNILSNPPFFRIDFISCRNLLIYFDAIAQKKVIESFHFSLNESGYLMLGKSETIGSSSQLFTQTNTKFKIYSRKKNTITRRVPELLKRFPNVLKNNIKQPLKKNSSIDSLELDGAIDSVLLTRYMPACAIINKDMEILQFRGSTSSYLTHPSGKASLNILKMMRPEFSFELRNAIQKAITTKQVIHKSGIEIKIDSELRNMSIEVCPLKIEWDEPLLIIIFTFQQQVEKYIENSTDKKNNLKQKDFKILKLTEELNNARAEMHSVMESQESAYEELQSANEEIVSTNEEFQTLNEELETSKEEVEASNEELVSTNREMQIRNDMLSESYEFSEAITATIHEPMVILDAHLNIKSANKSFYKKFHTTLKQTEGISFFKLGNKQWEIPKLRELLEGILSKNQNFENVEITHVFAEAGEKIMLFNGNRIVQKIHGEKLILLAIKDVTDIRRLAIEFEVREKKVLEDLLKAEKKALKLTEDSNMRYNMMLMQSQFAFAILKGKNMVITLANDSIKEMWGKGNDLEGKTVLEVFPEVRTQVFPQLLDDVYETGIPFHSNEILLTLERHGKTEDVYFNLLYQPYREVDDTISGVTVIAIDVTNQVLLKREIDNEHVKQKEKLEKAVRIRTREINRNIAELEAANKDLVSFTYISSHDLQEPLRKIQVFSNSILKDDGENLSASSKEYFKKMVSTAKRMQNLIEDLLKYSRTKNGDRVFENTDINVLVEDVKKDLEIIIKQKNAVIEVKDLCTVRVIPFQFRQLLFNLISNSLKFSKPNVPPHILIKSKIIKGSELNNKNLKDTKKYCHITISDNGMGFDSKYNERIFEVFQRLHSITEFEGTGIGLAICKRIVENHKGEITATGEIGKGARFDLYILAN